MTDEPTRTTSGSKNFLLSLLRGVVRLALVLLVGAILGAGLYFGWIFINAQIRDTQTGFEERVARLEQDRSLSQGQVQSLLDDIGSRLAALEQQRTLDREKLSALQADMETLQRSIDAQTASIQRLDELEILVNNYTGFTSYQATQVGAIYYTQNAPGGPYQQLRREIRILRAMELLNRARLFLLQSNYGLAADDIRFARDELALLYGEVSPFQQAVVQSWLDRLNLSLANLPASPVQAADDLEIAWRLLLGGLPPDETPTPFSPPGGTPTPVGPGFTPTPYGTPTPSPTAIPVKPT